MVPGMIRVLQVAVVLVAAGLATAGCTVPGSLPPPGPAETGSAATPSPPTTPSATAPSGTDRVASESARLAGIDLTALPEPVATGRVPARVHDDPDATMEVALHALRRTGKVLVATFSFRVVSAGSGEGSATLYGYLGELWSPHLVDSVNLRRHRVLSNRNVPAQTQPVHSQRFRPGQTFYAYAMFAAPPEGVTTMDVQLLTGLPTAVGVPIT